MFPTSKPDDGLEWGREWAIDKSTVPLAANSIDGHIHHREGTHDVILTGVLLSLEESAS